MEGHTQTPPSSVHAHPEAGTIKGQSVKECKVSEHDNTRAVCFQEGVLVVVWLFMLHLQALLAPFPASTQHDAE